MDRSAIVVTSLCVVAFLAAVFAVSLVSAGASRSGTSELTQSARDLVAALQGERIDVQRVRRLLAPGVSLEDERAVRVLRELASVVSHPTMVRNARVEAGGRTARTDLVVVQAGTRRRPFGASPDVVTLQWVRDAGGRWGFDPLAR